MKRKLLSILSCLCMALSLCVVSAPVAEVRAEEPSSEASMQIDVTMFVTQVNVTVPLNVNCIINPNVEDGFTYGDVIVQNNSAAPVKVSLCDFTQTSGGFTMLTPNAIGAVEPGLTWDSLNSEQSARYLSIGASAGDAGWIESLAEGYAYADNVTEKFSIGVVAAKDEADLKMEAHYGRSFKLEDEVHLRMFFVTELCSDTIIPNPDNEGIDVPQTGTWQLKNTTGKKYIILSTDDDNMGDAKFFRLLRTYGFPYTMNVEAENVSTAKELGSDIDDTIFTENDAPALFPDGVDLVTLGKYIHDNDLGEVAQHGSSAKVLWDSSKLTGDYLTSIHTSYVEKGGTKTQDELRTAIMEQLSDTDGSQGAVYVDNSRRILEEAYGFPIYTVGAWGGVPTVTIDGIECDMNAIKGTSNYDWRAKNYMAAATVISGGINKVPNGTTLYDLYRSDANVDGAIEEINNTEAGEVIEFFWHMPFNDEPDISKWRTLFDYIKSLEDSGKAEVITRKQYAELGEYVENPVTKISLTRTGSVSIGDVDSDDAYTIVATYADGTTADVKAEAILDRSAVNTSESGVYVVRACYRGFNAYTNIFVADSNFTLPEDLKSTDYWFVYLNDTNGNLYCGNSSKDIVNAYKTGSKLLQFTTAESGGKINGWKSSDNGLTWTQVTTDKTVWNTSITTNKTSDTDGGYQFNSAYNDSITWLDTSGNFDITY